MFARTRFIALGFAVLAGCYAKHAPWEHAAPDGSAMGMRVEVSGVRGAGGGGFLQVRFDRTYVASPMNELRVCSGTVGHGELDAWIALIERTDAFAREGNHGNVIDGGITEVRLWSERKLSARFALHGGPGFGNYDPALAGFTDALVAFWQMLDLKSCAPTALDPAASIDVWIDPVDWGRAGAARIKVTRDGTVRAFFAPSTFRSWDDDELVPCAPLADSEPFWATVLAAAPLEPRPAVWHRTRGSITADVTAADGTTHERWAFSTSTPPGPSRLGWRRRS